jgi:hypothetical protein
MSPASHAAVNQPSEPIFIVGCGRSGTTLLRLMLNRHPRIAIPGETWYFPDIEEMRTGLATAPEQDWRAAVATRIERSSTFRELGVSRDQIDDALSRISFNEWGNVLAVANLAFARAEGKDRWGDKTPGYVRHLPLLKREFPAAFVVHMIRDARDVAASFFEQPFGPKTAIEAAIYWKKDVSRGQQFGVPLFGDRYIEIRYEDLAKNPEAQLRKVLSHVGEDFDPVVLDQAPAAGEYVIPEHHWHELTKKPVTTTRVGRWRTKLSPRDAQLIELEAGAMLRQLHYATDERPSPSVLREWIVGRVSRFSRRAVLSVKRAAYRALRPGEGA